MAIAGPDGVDAAIKAGVDLDGSPIPEAMLSLYGEVMDLEGQRARSGVLKSMRKPNREDRCQALRSSHTERATYFRRLGWLEG
jgi:hypothetical protein